MLPGGAAETRERPDPPLFEVAAGPGEVARSGDGRLEARPLPDHAIRLVDAATDATITRLEGHAGAVRGLAFGPGDRTLLSRADDGTARVWDLPAAAGSRPVRARLVLSGPPGALRAAAWSRCGTRIATGSGGSGGTARVWNARDGRLLRTFAGHGAAVTSVAFAPDAGRLAIGCGHGSTALHGLGRRRERQVLRGRAAAVVGVAFSSDGSRLFTTAEDAVLRVFEVPSGAACSPSRSTTPPARPPSRETGRASPPSSPPGCSSSAASRSPALPPSLRVPRSPRAAPPSTSPASPSTPASTPGPWP